MIDILGGAFRDILFYGQVHAEDVIEMPGGTGYNVFAGLREIGIESVFHCAIGDDWPFENLRHVRGKSGIFVCRNETEILAVYRGVNLDPPVEEIKSKILFSTFECGGSTFEKYARAMKNSGGMVILDPSPVFEWKKEYADLCDLLIPNENEFESISSLEFKKVFLKLGENGGKYIQDTVEISKNISKKGKFPLGCGDAFDVAVIYGLLTGKSPEKTLEMAVDLGQSVSFLRGSSSAVVEAVKTAKKCFFKTTEK
ncbi:MAG: PfkB family carbohydrate kinase [Thermotogae bacterium]|jgi:sugar/nucleoside kinase (ribokinase family)|nr:PfkB family carbohydrate kinase [Thermotogota bacterium]